ncbi:SLC13/DASS family transporter [Corallincola luteus]|uniref:SLC13/DASS family transporter n=2 Tax=Corallincola TaxID=1775176 RepID=A0A368NLK6_9GAMM|nr:MULTISPECIES: SLC13 family permease [Corallincola]RCU51482.1 SLC13/DASS family transporter [Corallincola holothuriorum]TCI04639.1 SLC13/DASS family transporter [Corallincola luteus]
MNIFIKLGICLGLPLVVLLLPVTAFPIEGLSLIEQRVIAIFLLAALCWVLEPFPIYATSVLVIVIELLLVSDKGLIFLRSGAESEGFGTLISHKAIMATMASPIIMLFLGGFFLAMAATKYRLDVNLARVLLKPFGQNPAMVMLGLMGITAIFSMFMSNTATTAMMLSILAPVLGLFKAEDRGRIAFALSIPVAANIGGIGTPIGTPPNAIALKYLVGEDAISFGSWMAFAVPFVIIMLAFAWVLLVKMFPAAQEKIELNIRGKFQRSPKAILVYVTFTATILLWLFGSAHGMNSYVVAMIPVAVFSVTKVITKEDLKKISWDVLWLVAGGFALGLAMDKSGLARNMVAAIPFDQFSPYLVIASASALCLLMANFMSHTATANLLMPIVVALAVSMDSLIPLGGTQALILCVTFAASLGMSLPISTPPNALAHATGYMQTGDMAKVGVIIGIVGLLMTYAMVFILRQIGFV